MFPSLNSSDYYFQLAMKYDLLSQYYKYLNPALHIECYQKHLQAMQNGLMMAQADINRDGYRRYAYVRMFHASPNTQKVDVFVNGFKVVKGLKFKQASQYIQLPAGVHSFAVYPSGQKQNPILRDRITINDGTSNTVAIAGKVENLSLKPIVDQAASVEGKSTIRFVHLSPDAPIVDVKTREGVMLFAEISFKEVSKYLSNKQGNYDFIVTQHGTEDILLNLPNIKLAEGKTNTIYIVGLTEGSPALTAIQLEDVKI